MPSSSLKISAFSAWQRRPACFDDGIEHGLEIELRSADDAQHVDCGGLIFERFGQLARCAPAPPRTAACSRWRSRPGRRRSPTARSCLLVKGPQLSLVQGDDANLFAIAKERHSEIASEANNLRRLPIWKVWHRRTHRESESCTFPGRRDRRACPGPARSYEPAMSIAPLGRDAVGRSERIVLTLATPQDCLAFAPQSRAAASIKVSSTVCRSNAERLMTLSTSAVAVCCWRGFAQLVEQPRVLDGDDGLVGEVRRPARSACR